MREMADDAQEKGGDLRKSRRQRKEAVGELRENRIDRKSWGGSCKKRKGKEKIPPRNTWQLNH